MEGQKILKIPSRFLEKKLIYFMFYTSESYIWSNTQTHPLMKPRLFTGRPFAVIPWKKQYLIMPLLITSDQMVEVARGNACVLHKPNNNRKCVHPYLHEFYQISHT